jgi:hypothetical protein
MRACAGHTAHGGDVADRPAERFPADAARVFFREKMHAFDDGIGFEKLPAGSARAADDGAIIPGADEDVRAGGEAAGEEGNEPIFAEVGERGRGLPGGR